MNRVVRIPASLATRRRKPAFGAIDFETADQGRDSACALAVVRVEGGKIATKLDHVCEYLHIPLNHHDASSDAEACARIVLAAMADGADPRPFPRPRSAE